jgi:phosphohistidine phosphatase
MQRLILMRHAQAERAPSGGEDIDRRLTPAGEADARLMGRLLAEQKLIPDQALVSSAIRAQETWAAVSESFPMVRIQVRQSLYLTGPGALRELAERAGVPGETLMIVGHNPGLHELALRLLIEGSAAPGVTAKLASGFPPATVAAFTIDAAGRASYDGLFLARDHGGGGHE